MSGIPSHSEPPGRQSQFTLRQLLLVMGLLSVSLALTTQWRHIGFVLACFFVACAVGTWRKHAGMFFAGLTGLIVFVTTYAAAWVQLGDNFTMNSEYLRGDTYLLRQLDAALAQHAQEEGAFPQTLEELDNSQREFPVDEEGRLIGQWRQSVHYRRLAEGYELATLGRDGEPGGLGGDADLESPGSSRSKAPSLRLPFRYFAFEANGSWGVFLAALVGSLMTANLAWSLPKQLPNRNQLLGAVIVIAVGASVVAVFLAGFYVAAGNSGH